MHQEEPAIPGGYIFLSRKIIESQIWQKPPLYLKVWIYLLASAQHRDYKKLKRGQLRTSIPEIIEACSWKVGFRTERPSRDQIFQILNWLREAGEESVHEAVARATMITTTKATHGILINIDNYCFYQDSRNYESNDESNNEAVTTPTNINKNDKNVNKGDISMTPKQPEKLKFLDTVFLTQNEYDRLIADFGKEKVEYYIAKLDEWQTNKTAKQQKKDHNKAIRVWIRGDELKKKERMSIQQGSPSDREAALQAKAAKERERDIKSGKEITVEPDID